VLLGLLAAWVVFGLGWALLRALPKPPLLGPASAAFPSSVAVYDSRHRLLRLTLSSDEKYRLWTPLAEMSPTLIEATLLHEDRHYYHHFAVNPVALGRAVYSTYLSGARRVGGSTITMQVARLRYRLTSRSVAGKLQQIARAVWLELRYSKAEILEAYLNLCPFGKNIEGVAAASLIYFGKPVNKLLLPEALTLAVIPQSPARRNPGKDAGDNQALAKARNGLFEKWALGHPSARKDESLLRLPLLMREPSQLPFRAPHVVDSLLGTAGSQSELLTTIDLSLQGLVERQLKNYVARQRRIGIHNAAAMLVDTRDMAVKAVVGSADFFDSQIEGQVNGTQAKRSPGSTLKRTPWSRTPSSPLAPTVPRTLTAALPARCRPKRRWCAAAMCRRCGSLPS